MQLDVPHAIVLRAGEGETIVERDERTIRILVEHEWLDVTWTICAPGECSADPHVHERHVDAFYVLAGEITLGLGPDLVEVRAVPGTFVAAPPGLVHTFRNEGPGKAEYLNFHAPSTGFADFLRGKGSFDSHDPPADGGRPLSDGVVRMPGEGERNETETRARTLKCEFEELSVLELDVWRGWTVDPHDHDDQVDSFFVLEGDAEFANESGWVTAGAGAFAAAVPGAVHGFRVFPGTRFLNFHAPDAGFAARFR